MDRRFSMKRGDPCTDRETSRKIRGPPLFLKEERKPLYRSLSFFERLSLCTVWRPLRKEDAPCTDRNISRSREGP